VASTGVTYYLLDTSALHLLTTDPAVADRWEFLVGRGLLAICDPVEVEFLYRARSLDDFADLQRMISGAFPWHPVPDGAWGRAKQVQRLLVEEGEHRSAGAVDLLVAAIAEEYGMTVLHRDRDFDRIAKITGQPVVRIDGGMGGPGASQVSGC
jgi:predicted nucleic acid-binding protein